MAPETTKVVPLTCHGHSRPVTHLSFSAVTSDDQYYLISACKDNNPMLRDGITGDWIGTFIGHKGAVWQARLSADATLAATGSADFSAKIWDTHTGETLDTLQHNHIVRAVAFPPNASPRLLATGGAEKKLRMFDLSRSGTSSSPASSNVGANGNTASMSAATNGNTTSSGYEIGADVHKGTIKSIVWTPNDTNVFITAAEDSKIRWWDLRSPKPIVEYAVEGSIGSCELNTTATSMADGSGESVLSVAAGKSVYFFEGSKSPGSLLKSIKLPQDAASVALNIQTRNFVTGGGGDTWVRVFNYDTGEELEIGKGHHGPVWSVCFSPNGKLYATGSEDGTVKLWKFTKEQYGLWR